MRGLGSMGGHMHMCRGGAQWVAHTCTGGRGACQGIMGVGMGAHYVRTRAFGTRGKKGEPSVS